MPSISLGLVLKTLAILYFLIALRSIVHELISSGYDRKACLDLLACLCGIGMVLLIGSNTD